MNNSKLVEQMFGVKTMRVDKIINDLVEEIRVQTILDIIAYFSEYNVPLTMTAEDIQNILAEMIENGD